ncbi:hypothetical protein D3C71_77900 [compost metagenome]
MAKEFKKVIEAANSGKRFPVMSLVRENPELAAVISKLIPAPEHARFDNSGNREPLTPNVGGFKTISEQKAQNISDAETVLQMLPDLELAFQILISSILAPKDLMTTELTYSLSIEGLLAPDVSAMMLNRLKEYFEQVHKIKPLLPVMLRDILAKTGSYAVAVIPENTIDDVINGPRKITMESLGDTLDKQGQLVTRGLLGPVVKDTPTVMLQRPVVSLENLRTHLDRGSVDPRMTFETVFDKPVSDSFVTVTDNLDLLKIPLVYEKIREQRILNVVGSRAMESIGPRLNDREMTALTYRERQFSYKPITSLRNQDQLHRNTVGNPLVMHFPSESVIPVYVPGAVEKQVGFFVLLDSEGHAVSRASNTDYYQELASRLNSNGSFPSAMLNKVKNQMGGTDFSATNQGHLDYAARAYGSLVEQDLLARLRHGAYGNGVALANAPEVYRIMLARALSKQHTQLLFVPVELMTYMAFRFDNNGVGRSLLDDMQILTSQRAMLMFANTMAALRNSIGRTEVKLKLDPDDPDPQKTIEISMHEIIRSRQQYFPLGMNSPTDLVDWLQRSGFEFTFEGHPGIPDVAIDFGEKSSQYIKPDTDLEESLRKRTIQATGLSPETVDAAQGPDFATSILTSNLLLSKRVMQIQDQFMPMVTDNMRKIAMNSEELITDLKKILTDNFTKLKIGADKESKKREQAKAEKKEQLPGKVTLNGPAVPEDPAVVSKTPDQKIAAVDAKLAKEYVVGEFLREFLLSFEVTLPRPNSATLENQATAMDTYTKMLDASLNAWVDGSFFTTETGGDVAGQVETMKQMLRAHFLRQWMAENGVMPELAVLTMQDEEGNPEMDVMKLNQAHVQGLIKSMTTFMEGMQPAKEAANKIMSGLNVDTSTTSSGTPDDNLESAGGGGDTGGGDNDFSFDEPSLDEPTDDAAGGGGTGSSTEETEESSTTTNADGSTSSSSSSSSSSSGTT